MDLVAAFKKKLDALPEGEHVAGLRAVLRHVEVGFAHLQRGQDLPDDSAFTDAIYRSNQAFEGGIKEAYRVLAGKSPEKVKPFDIENYLDQTGVFRPRVLALFTNYRKEWRNPSTHDYKLDFDESEALLACVSVAAFSCLLSDQIAEALAFQRVKKDLSKTRQRLKAVVGKDGVVTTLAERVAEALVKFSGSQQAGWSTATPLESQLLGAVAGYLTALTPKETVQVDVQISPDRRERADLLVSSEGEKIVVELKLLRGDTSGPAAAMAQIEHYITIAGATAGVLFLAAQGVEEYSLSAHNVAHSTTRIYVVAPLSAASTS